MYETCSINTQTVLVEALITFKILWILSFPIKILSKFEFDSTGRIIEHTDIWSVMDVLSSIFFFGFIYDFCRRRFGDLVSWVS